MENALGSRVDSSTTASLFPNDFVENARRLEQENCRFYQFLLEGILNIALCIFGLVGNALTLAVVWKDRKQSATAYLLVVLAVVDNSVLIIWGVVRASYSIPRYVGGSDIYIHGYVQQYGWSLASTVHLMSTWAVVMITAVRYVSVCLPHRSNQWLGPGTIRKVSSLVLGIGCMLLVPRFFDGYVVYSDAQGLYVRYRYMWTREGAYDIFYLSVLVSLALYVAPLSILIFCTCRLISHVAKASKKRREMTNSSRAQHDLTLSLVVVVVVFVICQITTPIQRIWGELVPSAQRRCPTAFFYYRSVANSAPVVNSAINFVVFMLCGKGFRARVHKLLCQRFKVYPGSSMSGTKSSNNSGSGPGQLGQNTLPVVD